MSAMVVVGHVSGGGGANVLYLPCDRHNRNLRTFHRRTLITVTHAP